MMELTTACFFKEKYAKIKYVDYIMENINRARVFFRLVYHPKGKVMKSKIIEIKGKKMKSIFRNIAVFYLRNYLYLLSMLFEGRIIVSDEYIEKNEIGAIREADGKVNAIFGIKNLILDTRNSRVTLLFSIVEVFISKDFFIKLLENIKNFYRINNENTDALEKLILFVKKSHSKFFLMPFAVGSDECSFSLKIYHHNDLLPKFIFEAWLEEVNDYMVRASYLFYRIQMRDYMENAGLSDVADEINSIIKKSRYLELELENIVNIINMGRGRKAEEENAKLLIHDIFIHLLFYYLSNSELSTFKKLRYGVKSDVISGRSFTYTYLKHKAKRNPLLVLIVNLIKTMIKVPNDYTKSKEFKKSETFEGDITLITKEIKCEYDYNYCLITFYFENKRNNVFLKIEIYKELVTYSRNRSEVDIKVTIFRDFPDMYIYSKKENLDIFMNDIGKFLTRLGLLSHPKDLLLLAKYAMCIQLLSGQKILDT